MVTRTSRLATWTTHPPRQTTAAPVRTCDGLGYRLGWVWSDGSWLVSSPAWLGGGTREGDAVGVDQAQADASKALERMGWEVST